ncbi:hypothetical protein Rvan_1517 [Rhodomicrobium vannielii ATCC 17100]|jgi:hypothetical protein|uniref:Uncharacterized protein n=1 Tax=Rhodomicrobium vannielii (strain ATCC 17100 / DSM 162 / LMG 4299 / NCIMB 10020 / ATH 3.1.1) TaxID=648757 RepID=E3I7B8_RHOVT|nr:hypothetical protein [Rhodomicrobium vannielii]ADP70769.1 hypothetical protein Rvan_1517 [Rhodomicrobium vannielii ATCC 17100]
MASAKREDERRSQEGQSDLTSNAKRALAEKKAAESDTEAPATQTASEGMQPNPNSDIAPSGALEQEGQRPVLERSRKVR